VSDFLNRGLRYYASAARKFSYNGKIVVDAEALADVVRLGTL